MQEVQSTPKETQEYGMSDIVEMLKANIQPAVDLRTYIPERADIGKNRDRNTSEILVSVARKTGDELYYALDRWLDFLLNAFDADRFKEQTFESNLEVARQEQPEFYDLMHRWVDTVYDNKEQGKCTDFFGDIYEENFKSSHKATQLGQFYTPMSISKMLGELVFDGKTDKSTALDCACGSGRLLLGYAEKEHFQRTTFYCAGDVDPQSVKMCALNFMMHGLQGVVLRQDALILNEPMDILLINQVDYPVETGLRSISRLTTEEALRIGLLSQRGEQFSLCDTYFTHHRNLLNLIKGIEIEKPTCTPPEKKQETAQPPKIRKPAQLSLFD